ncbi:MAG: sugar transferase [Beijerinckiaceae bacterium]|nr:sugar transferase [Beijerinckiaceae bacterium]
MRVPHNRPLDSVGHIVDIGHTARQGCGLNELHNDILVNPLGGIRKRVFDATFATIFLFLALPIFALVGIAIKFTDRGQLIFKHERIGFRGNAFQCFKFRTMVVDAEKALHRVLTADAAARREWARCQKLTDDPRITPVGRFLRRSSLDELPQLINVIRGEMSLVGPRPITPAEMSRYGDRLGSYLSARPGLTGPWQVSGRSDCDFNTRVALDAWYVSNWRFSNDIFILLRTITSVLKGHGSY